MVFSGIDVSLSKVGFSLISEDGKVLALHTFHDNNPIKVDRVIAQTDKVMEILKTYGRNVAFTAVEEPLWSKTRYVSYDIGMAYGMILEHLVRNGLNYIIVHPSKLKTFVADHRLEGKFPIKEWCVKQGVSFPDGKVSRDYILDMADAYVLSRIAKLFYDFRNQLFLPSKLPDHQYRIFSHKDIKGHETGLLDRPDLYRIFS